MRLQRALARAGVASRRGAEHLIAEGRVRVNGQVAEIGTKVEPGEDTITVDGRRIRPAASVWLVLNKPRGYVVTRRDPERRATVFDLVPDIPGLTYVGRLDVDSAGLLLMTTDGVGANRLTHPRYQTPRTYRVLVRGAACDDIRRALSGPVVVGGRRVALRNVKVRPGPNGTCDVTLVLAEGRYHIVRRICEQLHLEVDRLIRLSHGPIRLGRLAPGKWRYLTSNEIDAVTASSEGDGRR